MVTVHQGVENSTAGLQDRPGLKDMWNYLKGDAGKTIDAVIICKLDRLARDLYIQGHLIKKLESPTSNLSPPKSRTLIAMSQCERPSGSTGNLTVQGITIQALLQRIVKLEQDLAMAVGI